MVIENALVAVTNNLCMAKRLLISAETEALLSHRHLLHRRSVPRACCFADRAERTAPVYRVPAHCAHVVEKSDGRICEQPRHEDLAWRRGRCRNDAQRAPPRRYYPHADSGVADGTAAENDDQCGMHVRRVMHTVKGLHP